MPQNQMSSKDKAEKASDLIEAELDELTAIVELCLKDDGRVEPLNIEAIANSFNQWRSQVSALLAEQVNPQRGHEFERRIKRLVDPASLPAFDILEETFTAQDYLHSLMGMMMRRPDDVLSPVPNSHSSYQAPV